MLAGARRFRPFAVHRHAQIRTCLPGGLFEPAKPAATAKRATPQFAGRCRQAAVEIGRAFMSPLKSFSGPSWHRLVFFLCILAAQARALCFVASHKLVIVVNAGERRVHAVVVAAKSDRTCGRDNGRSPRSGRGTPRRWCGSFRRSCSREFGPLAPRPGSRRVHRSANEKGQAHLHRRIVGADASPAGMGLSSLSDRIT